jgi:hypothetical protein
VSLVDRVKGLTFRQERMLRRMAELPADMLWAVSGHNRTACYRLAERGLAEKVADIEAGLSSAYRITEDGRALLHPDLSKGGEE